MSPAKLDRHEVERRLRAGETQAQIARALGVTQPAVSRALKRYARASGNITSSRDAAPPTRTGSLTPAEYRALRESRGWTQQQLADRLEKHRVTVGEREAGRQPIDREAELALRYLAEREG